MEHPISILSRKVALYCPMYADVRNSDDALAVGGLSSFHAMYVVTPLHLHLTRLPYLLLLLFRSI